MADTQQTTDAAPRPLFQAQRQDEISALAIEHGRVDVADLQVWQTAVLYHLIHGLGLFVVAGLAQWLPASGTVRLGGASMARPD